MQHPFNVTLASRDFRLPIAPAYAQAEGGRSGYEYIRDHLGYRIELQSATLPQKIALSPGAEAGAGAVNFTFRAALVNWGFAAPVSPRPVQLVLLAANGSIAWRSASLADPRDWQPHIPGDPTFLPQLHRLTADVSIPRSVLTTALAKASSDNGGGSATLQFGLHMPDMRPEKAAAAGSGPAYCIRLANSDEDAPTERRGEFMSFCAMSYE